MLTTDACPDLKGDTSTTIGREESQYRKRLKACIKQKLKMNLRNNVITMQKCIWCALAL